MEVNKELENEAATVYPEPANGFWTETQKFHVEKLREAYIAGATSSSTIKELERELRTVTTEYEYAMKLLCEATGQVYSENNVTISAKQVLNNL